MYQTVKRNTRNLMTLPGSSSSRYMNDETFMKRGGFIAGLVNEGNTCFMNSVLQSLASSKELNKFLDEMIENSDDKEDELNFSAALLELLDKLNIKYGRDKPYFRTSKLLKNMSHGPNKNIILGYDQEDAQEFFQQILSDLEKNVKIVSEDEDKEKDNEKKNEPQYISESNLPEDALLGQKDLDRVGTVYIPTEQIEPNLVTSKLEKYFTPLKLITPLDGIAAERIGCLTCGENGGIRYSVFSGLSLNLPSETLGNSTLKLLELLNEWSKPEIIEGVDCNRCALNAVRVHLQTQFENSKNLPEKLIKAIEDRISKLDDILAKSVIDDVDYKKLHTENMVRKCSKSKQIIISRPPPLLSIHINRSVFDPRTYSIRKNNARVLFKSRINLDPWCCTPDEINLDARLPLSKKDVKPDESSEDENVAGDYYAKLHHRFEQEFEDSDEEEEEDTHNYNSRSKDVEDYDPLHGEMDNSDYSTDNENEEYYEETDALGNTVRGRVVKENEGQVPEKDSDSDLEPEHTEDVAQSVSEEESEESEEEQEQEQDEHAQGQVRNALPQASFSTVPATPLTYSLRSVIVHYGTHNYGHYIAFRRYRGYWWRISDETVYIVEEAEVLSTPGVFMLFYEYDYDETNGKMKDDVEILEEDNVEIEITGENQSDGAMDIDEELQSVKVEIGEESD